MTSDSDLLRRYAQTRSEEAFAEVVSRHLGLVYSAALRQLAGDTHRAKDVSQMVFTDLARKAARLARHPALSAWLYQSTRYAVAGVVRTEIRRKNREKEADAMREIHESPEPVVDWARIGPVIDEVILTLNEREQEAICLRFFKGQTFAEIGARYQVTADAARFRVERALEKMRHQLSRRGVSSTAVALALVLETQWCAAAPAGLAVTIAGAAAVGAAPTGLSLFLLMATYKQIGIAAALVAAAASVTTVEIVRQHALQREIASLSAQTVPLPALRAENQRLRAARDSFVPGQASAPNRPAVDHAPRNAVLAGLPGGAPANPGAPAKRKAVRLNMQPTLLDRIAPAYPADLLGSGISGPVTLEFIVNSDGSVTGAFAKDPSSASSGELVTMVPDFVPKSSPPASTDLSNSTRNELELAALKAVSQWVFQPGNQGGRDTNTRMQVVVQVSPPAPFIPPTQ